MHQHESWIYPLEHASEEHTQDDPSAQNPAGKIIMAPTSLLFFYKNYFFQIISLS